MELIDFQNIDNLAIMYNEPNFMATFWMAIINKRMNNDYTMMNHLKTLKT